jgi:hypothetical protein
MISHWILVMGHKYLHSHIQGSLFSGAVYRLPYLPWSDINMPWQDIFLSNQFFFRPLDSAFSYHRYDEIISKSLLYCEIIQPITTFEKLDGSLKSKPEAELQECTYECMLFSAIISISSSLVASQSFSIAQKLTHRHELEDLYDQWAWSFKLGHKITFFMYSVTGFCRRNSVLSRV